MTVITKFDIPKFNDKMSFNIWKVQMMVVLTQNGLKKALGGNNKKLATMTDEQWEELDEKTLSMIQLHLTPTFFLKFLTKHPLQKSSFHYKHYI